MELERQLQEIADDERVREVGVTLRDILVNLASCSIQEPRADSRLDAYLELPPGLRERVHNQVNRPELAWIEPILTGLGARRARAAAAAVLALVELKPELEQRSTEALVRLQPHVEILEMMPQSAQLIASARDRVRLQRQAMVLEQLHQAEQAMTECNANEAMRVLEAVSLDDLDPKGRERKLGLQSAARFSIEQTDLENRLALLHDQGDFFRAKEIASRLAERTKGDEKLAWIGRHKEIRDEIARTWCWMTGVGEIGDFWMLGVKVRSDNPAPEPWIEPSGVTAMCCITAGPWILLVRRGLESGQVESWVRMVLPRPVENIGIGRITDEVVVLVADDEATLVVSVKDWEIIDYHETSLPGDWRASQCIVSRDARWLWYAQCRKRDKWEFRVQAEEIASRRIARSFDNADLMPVVGSHDAEVGVIGKDRISFHRARGGPESGLTVSATLSAVVQAPSGRGLIGVVEDEHGGNLVLLGPILPGQKPTKLNLKGSSSASHQLAVALKDSLLVVCYYADDGRWLEAFVESNGRPDSLYRARISDEALLITDRGGLCLWVLGLESGKVAARRVVR